MLAGIFTYFFLPNRPADAKFLKPDEKDCILAELRKEESEKLSIHRITARQVFTNGQIWYLISLYFPYLLSMYTVVFWMPQLIKAATGQFSDTAIGSLVMLPYTSAVLAMIIVARSSDRSLERRYHAACPEIVAAIALFLISTIVAPSLWLLLVLWCLVAMGIFSFMGPFWSLPCTFLAGSSAAVGIALINSIGNIGGFVGPYAMGAIHRRTGSFRGGLVLAGFSLLISATLLFMSPKMLKHTAGWKIAT